jgi:hypothetical protein
MTRKDVRSIAEHLILHGYEVWIVTSRYDDNYAYKQNWYWIPGQNEKVFHHPLQKTRCTHCYIISSEAAQKMIEGFGNINLPIDFKMNEVIQINRMKIGWVEPGLKQITF